MNKNNINLNKNQSKVEALRELSNHLSPNFVVNNGPDIINFCKNLSDAGILPYGQDYFKADDVQTIESANVKVLYPPILFNGVPSDFPQTDLRLPLVTAADAYKVAKVADGYVGMVYDAPTVFDKDRKVEPEFSSFYSVLNGYVDDGKGVNFDDARYIDGDLFVMHDDIGLLNYSHWLADWLPRLRAIQGNTDIYVLTLPLDRKWQIDLLECFGIGPERCISLPQWGAVRARNIYVPSALTRIFHPAYQGADWVRQFLQSNILGKSSANLGPKIYLSRRDAPDRRVLNEDKLEEFLQSLGFQCFSASEYTPCEQASIFHNARTVVSLHGAGLTNIIFCKPGTKILELLPNNYSTPAFWIIASTGRLIYGTYICENTVKSENRDHPQAGNVIVDIDDLSRLTRDYLLYD
jgi:capsular polysaccharide biosynthesis protein